MNSVESFTAGEHLAVDFSAIERELKSLWKAASEPAPGEAAPPVTRACQTNLVVCCEGSGEAARATEVVARLASVRPSRVVMAVADRETAEDGLRASITAHCSYVPGAGAGKQVCCEQITIVGSGGGLGQVQSAVLPLLLADLPVFVWCAGDMRLAGPDGASHLDRSLLGVADRVVIDSCRFRDPAACLAEAASLSVPVADLAWERLRGWRELTAGLFDAPAHESQPSRIDAIRVDYGGDPAGHACGAALLGSWAAGRLGWRGPVGSADRQEEGATFPRVRSWGMTRPREGEARITMAWQGPEAPPGVTAFRLSSPTAAFTLTRDDGADCVAASVRRPGAASLSHVGRVVERDEATLLWRSMGAAGPDRIFEEALRLAARLLARDTGETGR